MPHLFTHCLPTIICVRLMSIVFISFSLYFSVFFLCMRFLAFVTFDVCCFFVLYLSDALYWATVLKTGLKLLM